jgi:pimeloyl-ACP methyl ester carboxylesterase
VRYAGRVALAFAAFLPIAWIAGIAFLWANETHFVFRTSWVRVWAPFESRAFTPIEIAGDEQRLDGVVLRHATGDRYWILYLNSAGESIHGRDVRDGLTTLQGLGYNVLSFDYRGFGRTKGEPSEAGVYADATAAYRHLTDVERVNPAHIVLAGQSLGSAVAVELATRLPTAGLVLLSAIDSVPSVGARLFPWAPVRLLASHQFDSLAKIGRITVPIVIVHATDDRFIPMQTARALYDQATAPRLLLETTGGHDDAGFRDTERLAEALHRFWPAKDSPTLASQR